MTKPDELTAAEEAFAEIDQAHIDAMMNLIVETHSGMANENDGPLDLDRLYAHVDAACLSLGYMAACYALAGGLSPDRATAIRAVVVQRLGGAATQYLNAPTQH